MRALAGVLVALALVGCGKDEAGTTTTTPPEPTDPMAAFRECMAEQGVELPDPAGGAAPMTMPRTDRLQAAMGVCRDALPEDMVPAAPPNGDVLVG